MRNLPAITAALLVAVIFPASLYALQASPTPVDGGAKGTAINFVLGSPTFKFDGIGSTLKVVSVTQSKTDPSLYLVNVEYDCLHGGYGNRTGQIVIQAITPHEVILKVEDGNVKSAVLDSYWDEMAQKPIIQGQENVESIALKWLEACPTFVFDGIRNSVKVIESWQAQTFAYPSFWEVRIEFDSAHPGYGDRSGTMLAQVITHHIIRIHVTEGIVTMAIIDEKWDEMAQKLVEAVQPLTVITAEQARDIAVKQMLIDLGITSDLPTEWSVEQSSAMLGHNSMRYYSGDWTVTVDYAVVLRPNYNVTIAKVGEAPINWSGLVDGEGGVSGGPGKPLPVPAYILQAPEARDIAVKYLMSIHKDLTYPNAWNERSLVPDGIVGINKVEYKGGSWTIVVSSPVVWKPDYNVEVSYAGPTVFTWVGKVTQGGAVTPSN